MINRFCIGRLFRHSKRSLKRSFGQIEALESRTFLTVDLLSVADPQLYGDTSNGSTELPSMSSSGDVIAFRSFGTNLLAGVGVPGQIYAYNRTTNAASLVTPNQSVGGASAQGGQFPVVSDDGRFVLFISKGKDLVSQNVGSDLNIDQLYLRDLQLNTTKLVSVAADGINAANSNSGGVKNGTFNIPEKLYAFSGNGRFVVFWSDATNLVSPALARGGQLYIRDLQLNTTRLVSVGADGNAAAAPPGFNPIPYESISVSDDGRYVSFSTNINGLVAGDDNSGEDIFVRDLVGNVTRLVTSAGGTTAPANAPSGRSFLTGDGTQMYFTSQATNLVAGSSITAGQLYVRDLTTGTTSLVSHADQAPNVGSNQVVGRFTVTPDGRYVTFESVASNLVPGDTNQTGDIFLRDQSLGITTLVTRGADSASGANGYSSNPIISDDGSQIVFTSRASNLVTDFIDNNQTVSSDLFVFHRLGGTIQLLTSDRNQSNSGGKFPPVLDPNFPEADAVINNNGSVIAFRSDFANLIESDNNFGSDIFLHTETGTTAISSRDQSLSPAYAVGGTVLGSSADGRFILVTSSGPMVNSFSTAGGKFDLYIRDTLTGTTKVVPDSRGLNATLAATITPDGRYIVFLTDQFSVRLYDRQTLVTEIISQTPTHTQSQGFFFDADISADGRFVAFSGIANDLIPGLVDGSPGFSTLFLRDRLLGETVLVNRKQGSASTSSNGGIFSDFLISSNGQQVFFDTRASDLTANDSNGANVTDIYAFNVANSTVTLVSANAAGTAAGSRSSFTASADGRFLAFSSTGDNLVAGVLAHGVTHVYVRDLQTGINRLVDVSPSGIAVESNATNPQISADGRQVAFQSSAIGLVTGLPTEGNMNVYVRDLTTNSTSLVSVTADGSQGGNQFSSLDAEGEQQISANGRYVVFESAATNLIPGFVDGNDLGTDLFIRDLLTGTTELVTRNQTGTASGNQGISANADRPFIVLNDGRVIFGSSSTNLTMILDANSLSDAFNVNPFAPSGGEIRGVVFDDIDANGNREPEENGLLNAIVYLDTNGNGLRDPNEPSILTGADGSYVFSGVALGSYQLRQDVGATTLITTPVSGFYATTITADGQVISNQVFGNQVARADLIAEGVNSSTFTGTIDVSWTVTNLGQTATVAGEWQDAIYLSMTQTLGPDSILLTTVTRTGDLPVNGSYQGHQLVAAAVGQDPTIPYFVIVQTDRRRVVAESVRTNNVAASATLTTAITDLPLGATLQGDFAGSLPVQYFKVTVDPGEIFRLSLDSVSPVGSTEILVRRQAIPTITDFDFRAAVSSQTDQDLTVSGLEGGTYYVLLRATALPAGSSRGFSLSASSTTFEIISTDQKVGDRAGLLTIKLDGAEFVPTMTAELYDLSGNTFSATHLEVVDPTQAYATFNLTQVPEGSYGIRLKSERLILTSTDDPEFSAGFVTETATATLPNALTVVAARQDDLQIVLTAPDRIRASRYFEIIVEAINRGTHDVIAPTLVISTSPEVRLNTTLDAYHSQLGALTVVAINHQGIAGVIRPGQSGSATLQGRSLIPALVEIKVSAIDDDASAVDYTSLFDELGIEPASPRGVLAAEALQAQFGTSWSSYQQGLADQATKLSRNGRYIDSETGLLSRAVYDALEAAEEASGQSLSAAPLLAGTLAAKSAERFPQVASDSAARDASAAAQTANAGPSGPPSPSQLQSRESALRTLAEEMRALAGEDSEAARNLERFLGPDGENTGYSIDRIVYGPESVLSAEAESNIFVARSFRKVHETVVVPKVEMLLEEAAQSGATAESIEGMTFTITQADLPGFYALPDPLKLVFPFGAAFDLGATFGSLRTGTYKLTHVVLPERDMCGTTIKDYSVQIEYEFTDGYDFQLGSDTSGPILGPLNLAALTLAESGWATKFTTVLQINKQMQGKVELPPTNPNSADCEDERTPPLQDLLKKFIRIVSSTDPNDITGPAGFGPARYVTPEGIFPYTIRFENAANLATAPAQEVVITQQLDPDLDWSTFELDDFGFGSLTVEVDPGTPNFADRLTYTNQDGSPLFVDVEAGLDLQTGIVTWTFRSVDPETGLLPEGVFDGFLPINDATSRGEGFVSYRISPKSTLGTGVVINAVASIVFDANDPIATNVFTNSIDVDPPTASIVSLPATTETTTFSVFWTGSDGAGSGVATYDIFASDNDGPYVLWLNDTTLTSASYSGINQHSYRFYAVATDNLGFVEQSAQSAEATTTVHEVAQLNVGGPAVTWINRQSPVKVLPLVTVGNSNFGGGTLTLGLNVIGTKKKLLDLVTTPAFTGLGSSSGLVRNNSQLTMQIQLKPEVTASAIQAFLRGITFSTKGKGLKALSRTLTVSLTTANGPVVTISQTINIRKKA